MCIGGMRSRLENMMFFSFFLAPPLQQMCPVMSWLLCLCLWVSVSAIQLCQATFYDTIQQHPGLRPGRTTVHMIGESPPAFICLPKRFLSSSEGNQGIISVFCYWGPVNERALCTAALTPWPLIPLRSAETGDASPRPADHR